MEKLHISCKNDILFKFLMLEDIRLVKIILDGVTHYHELNIPTYNGETLTIKNPNLIPIKYQGKSIIFDLALEDDKQNFYDIEMQNTPLYTDLFARFHYYGSNMVVNQLRSGENYNTIKVSHQIILIDDMGDGNTLVKTLEPKDQYGEPEIIAHLYTHYVFLPYINVLAKEKGLKNLNLFEKIIYAVENDLNYDILELEEEVINCMNINKNIFMTSEEELHWAIARSAAEITEKFLRSENSQTKKMLQQKDTMIQEKDEVIQEKDLAIQEKEEVIQEKNDEIHKHEENIGKKNRAMKTAIENIMKNFNCSYDEAVKVTGFGKEVFG